MPDSVVMAIVVGFKVLPWIIVTMLCLNYAIHHPKRWCRVVSSLMIPIALLYLFAEGVLWASAVENSFLSRPLEKDK